MSQVNSPLTNLQAECLSDKEGRAVVINLLYDHRKGLTFEAIRSGIEERKRKQFPESQNILHHVPDRVLTDLLAELELAAIVREGANSIYHLETYFRKFLEKLLKNASPDHPKYSKKSKSPLE